MTIGGSVSGDDGSAAPAPARRQEQRLADLMPGTRTRVLRVDGDAAIARRLGELGFTPGAVVDVVRRAPLRDPVVYRVKGYEICLRRAQAAGIRTGGVEE